MLSEKEVPEGQSSMVQSEGKRMSPPPNRPCTMHKIDFRRMGDLQREEHQVEALVIETIHGAQNTVGRQSGRGVGQQESTQRAP